MMQCFAQQSNEMIDQPSEQHFIDDEDEEAEENDDGEVLEDQALISVNQSYSEMTYTHQ